MAGIDGLAVGDPVTAEQMWALFGSGHHPLAGPRGAALPAEASVAQIRAATRLGQPFKVYPHDIPAFRVAVAQACEAYNQSRGLPGDWPVPRDVRAELRSQLGRESFPASRPGHPG